MLKMVEVSALNTGMYVILPTSWMNHSFLEGSFIIKSREDIERIAGLGIREVAVDTARGLSFPNVEMIGHAGDEPRPGEPPGPAAWDPEKLVPPALKDSRMPKAVKAKVVYESSVEMMKRAPGRSKSREYI